MSGATARKRGTRYGGYVESGVSISGAPRRRLQRARARRSPLRRKHRELAKVAARPLDGEDDREIDISDLDTPHLDEIHRVPRLVLPKREIALEQHLRLEQPNDRSHERNVHLGEHGHRWGRCDGATWVERPQEVSSHRE